MTRFLAIDEIINFALTHAIDDNRFEFLWDPRITIPLPWETHLSEMQSKRLSQLNVISQNINPINADISVYGGFSNKITLAYKIIVCKI